jgi:putative transposase
MARQPRLVLPGHAHFVIQRGLPGQSAFADDIDRQAYLSSLHEAARLHHVALHAWALLPAEVQLLLTPEESTSLSLCLQAVGRTYVSAYNRRHARKGTLWDGRFRAGVVEPGPLRLSVLALIDSARGEPGWTSAAHRSGGTRDAALVDPPEFWALGNTPFEREGAYRERLAAPPPADTAAAWRRAALGGWPVASPAFAAALAAELGRPAQPRRAGRPLRHTP